MKTENARITEANQDLDNIRVVLDSRWKRTATTILMGKYIKKGEIRKINGNTRDNQIEYGYQDYKFISHSFREKDGYFYVIEAKEVKKEPKAYEVRVYQFDPVDKWIEELFLKGCRSNEPLGAQREGIALFREFRDCDDIEEQMDRHMIVDYEAKRDVIVAGRNSLIQPAGYHSLEKILNRQLVKPGEPVLVYYESDEVDPKKHIVSAAEMGVPKLIEVEKKMEQYLLIFRMPEEKFSIRGAVSGETSGDYIQLHDLWIQRPALSGYIVREGRDDLQGFSKSYDEKFNIERGVMNFGTFLMVLGREGIDRMTMMPELASEYGIGFKPARYMIRGALNLLSDGNGGVER